LKPGLLEKAAACGLRSLFRRASRRTAWTTLRSQHKSQNLNHDYNAAVRRLHDLGVMVNGSFVLRDG
jgi:hypothetical protein